MDFILDWLALGNAADGVAPPEHIGALLCVAEELAPPATVLPFNKVPIPDFRPIAPPQLGEAIAWIERQVPHRRVLVYCNAGVGRSTSVAIGYLCVAAGMGFGQAVEFVARKRPHMSILPELFTAIERLRAERRKRQ